MCREYVGKLRECVWPRHTPRWDVRLDPYRQFRNGSTRFTEWGTFWAGVLHEYSRCPSSTKWTPQFSRCLIIFILYEYNLFFLIQYKFTVCKSILFSFGNLLSVIKDQTYKYVYPYQYLIQLIYILIQMVINFKINLKEGRIILN